MAEFRCDECERDFGSEQSLSDHNRSKHYKPEREPVVSKKTKNWLVIVIIGLLLIGGIYLIIPGASGAKSLPPITMDGHVERVPDSHISKSPLALNVQKHMLEHVDGLDGVRGGVIINYDCENYECEEGLIGSLEDFAVEYDYVYVSPFKNMEVKIAVTSLGRIEKFDSLDERAIEIFITGKVPEVQVDHDDMEMEEDEVEIVNETNETTDS